MFTVIAGLRYEMAIVVEDNEDRAKNLTQLSIVLTLITAVVLFLVIAVFKLAIASFFNLENANYLFAIPVIVSLTSTIETLVWWLNRSTAYQQISVQRISTSVASTLYKLTHPFYRLFTSNGLILGHTLGLIVGALILLKKLPHTIWKLSAPQLQLVARKHRSFPRLSMPAALVNILATSMPVFLLAAFDSQAATGYFGNAYKLTYLPLSMLGMALSQVFFERIARLEPKSKDVQNLAHQLLNFAFYLVLIPGLVMLVWGDKIIPVLLGSKWVEAGVYAQLTIVFFIAMFLTSIFSVAFETYNKLNIQLIYNSTFFIATTGSMLLAYRLGYDSRTALLWFAITGTILRLGILNYFFVLFGKPIYGKTILGIAIFTIISVLGFYIKGQL